ncbi:MAG: NAD(P)H-dependent oxidoreductase [Actinomycetota bacterium]
MKILAIPATNSRNGINRQLMGYAATLLESGTLGVDASVEILDLNDYEMPIYSDERRHGEGFPEPAQRFLDQIGAADAVIVSFAEHNGSFSVAWKNVYDWASRIDMQVYQGRRVAMFATAPGPRGGLGVLEHAALAAPFFSADLVGTLSIPSFGENFDVEAGELSNAELRAEFIRILGALVATSVAAPSHVS